MKYKAVVLVHLGAPEDFSLGAAEDFLYEFLSDKNVLQTNIVLRKILAKFISKKRAPAYLANLKKTSVDNKMRLPYFAKSIAKKLEAKLQIPVFEAAIYGSENIYKRVYEISAAHENKILFIPLFPQASSATVATPISEILSFNEENFGVLSAYFADSFYIDALSKSIENYAKDVKEILVSYHSLPMSARGADSYFAACECTTELLRKKFPEKNLHTVWQSAMKFGKWLRPSAKEKLQNILQKGASEIGVICPGFFCECTETLLEINEDLRTEFLNLGGKNFAYIPCLDDSDLQINLLEKIVKENL